MTQLVWRIAAETRQFAADDMSGMGAKTSGGRWNAVDEAVVYSSTTRALACLETIVHLNAGGLPQNRYLIEIAIQDAVWEAARIETQATLPLGWDAAPAGGSSVAIGSEWLRQARTAVLIVPSILVPEEFNVVLNPAHRHMADIKARKVRKWLYDPRIAR